VTSNDELAAIVFALQEQVRILGSRAQLTSSTVGDTGDTQVAVDDAVADAAVTSEAVPALQDDVASSDESTSDLTAILQANSDDLDARFADKDIDLANAREELEESQAEIRDAFGQQLTGISDRVDQIVVGAGGTLLLYSDEAPTSDDKAPPGSTWWMINVADNLVGQWEQTGTEDAPQWTPRAIESDMIAQLDVGKLTAGQAAIAQVVAMKIAASTANIQTVNVANLFVTSSATMQQAVIDYLFANVVAAKKITADMIDVNSLNGVTLTGTIIKTAATGARLEMLKTRLDVYGDGASVAASIYAQTQGNYSGLYMSATTAGGTGQLGLGGPQAVAASGNTWSGTCTVNAYLTHGLASPQLLTQKVYVGGASTPRSLIIDGSNVADVRFVGSRFALPPKTVDGTPLDVIQSDSLVDVVVQAGDFRLRDGTSIVPLYGSTTVFTDANGQQTISHDLGKTPRFVFLTVFAPRTANAITVRLVSKAAGSFTIAWHYNDAAWASQSVADRGVFWQVVP
jgi:hypothetical protein